MLIIVIFPQTAAASPKYKYTMTYTFENRSEKVVTLTRDDISTPLFIQNSWQNIVITSSDPTLGPEWYDEDGNSFKTLNVPLNLEPMQKINFTVIYTIDSSSKTPIPLNTKDAEDPSKIPVDLVNDYCVATSTFTSDDAKIADLASSLTQNKSSVLDKVTRLVSWFTSNITYDSGEVPRYANETLVQRKGDCDDQSILLISMLRSLKIPAYMEIGVVINSGLYANETSWSGHLTNEEVGVGWHGWVEAYIPPWGWTPIDLTLAQSSDPLDKILKAPEYTDYVITVFEVSKLDYVYDSRVVRNRIIQDNIFVSTLDDVSSINQPPWVNPTVIGLGLALLAAILVMFYTAHRK